MPGTSQQFPAQTGFTDSGQTTTDTQAFRFVRSLTDAMSNYKYGAADAADNAVVCGVSMHNCVTGQPIGICFGGIGLLQVNAAATPIIAGDKVTCGAAGGIGTKAAAGGLWHFLALEPANTDGAIIRGIIMLHSTAPA